MELLCTLFDPTFLDHYLHAPIRTLEWQTWGEFHTPMLRVPRYWSWGPND